MPFIHIKSLPLRGEPVYPVLVRKISATFAEALAIDERDVTVTWEFFGPGLYAFGGATGDWLDAGTHQILVEVIVPDFNEDEDIRIMLQAAAETIATATRLPITSIFAHVRLARSGQVFDEGDIVEW